MKKAIKGLVFRTIGLHNYLKLLHTGFKYSFKLGLLKSDYIYKYHYFVHELINEGDYVVDIGANLGYYTHIFSSLVGDNGKVYAVEPVKPFFEILEWRFKNNPKCVLYNYALGTTEKEVTLTVPKEYGYLRTGLAKVDKDNTTEDVFSFNAKMVKASELLTDIPHIEYIKCDIEGYEEFVLPEMKNILEKHKPILQIESWGEHLEVVEHLMKDLNYTRYMLHNAKLYEEAPEGATHGDFIFIHESKKADLINKIKPTA